MRPCASTGEAISLSPGMALAHYNLGNTLLDRGRATDALAAYTDAIRIDSRLALAHGGLCRALQVLGRADAARRSCETAITLQPDLAVLHYDYAGVLQAQGRLDEAAAGTQQPSGSTPTRSTHRMTWAACSSSWDNSTRHDNTIKRPWP